ncbi:uncharacterized protein LOC134532660 isoform X2 [Bacillus rossius redtenbacheri]
MAQLETLEAKMASIEVSLSTAPRRKKNGSIGGGVGGGAGVVVGPVHRTSKDIARELEVLRNALRDKENMIQSLKGQLCSSLSISRLSASYLRGQLQPGHALSDKERRQAEDRLLRLRADMDNKRLAIKNLKMALERLDITDNIDVRIQQAELEYQLGREELNLLTLLEESRGLQLCLEDADSSRARADHATVYSCVRGAHLASLHAVELSCDPRSPRFGAGPRDDAPGLFVEWAAEDSGLLKGDRVLEVNGKLVLAKSKEDMLRLLAVAPDPAQLVVLRTRAAPGTLSPHGHGAELRAALDKAQEAELARDTLKSDNLRLTHRISYLEEQVSELLDRVKDPAACPKTGADTAAASLHPPSPAGSKQALAASAKTTPSKPEVQVFQKGPQVTAIVANLPGLDVGGSTPADSKHVLPTLRSKTSSLPKNHDARSTKSLDVASNCSSADVASHHHHHHHHHHHGRRKHEKHASHHNLQNAQSTNSLDVGGQELQSRLNARNRYHSQFYLSEQVVKSAHSVSDYASEASSTIDSRHHHHHKKYTDSLRRKSEQHFIAEMKNGRSHVDYTSESSTGTYHRAHRDARSIKSLDVESDVNRTVPRHYTPEEWPYSIHSQSRILESKSSTALDDASETSSNLSHQHRLKGDPCDGKPQRPKPPKKPLRLSLSRATSLQVVNTSPPPTPATCGRKPTKRAHNGESPPALQPSARTLPSMRWSSAAAPQPARGVNGFAASEKWC